MYTPGIHSASHVCIRCWKMCSIQRKSYIQYVPDHHYALALQTQCTQNQHVMEQLPVIIMRTAAQPFFKTEYKYKYVFFLVNTDTEMTNLLINTYRGA